VILEPVQGEGGFVPAPREFLQHLREFCTAHGIVLILDEVQSGFGRTGKMFAAETLYVEPDLMTMAKSIAGGFPLAALVGKASLMDAPPPGGVGSTYAGNPVACAAALAAIDVLERLVKEGQPDRLGQRVVARFKRLAETKALIGDVRGLGAVVAIELVRDRTTKEPADKETSAIVAAARERGVLLLTAGTYGNVIRFLFPLTTTEAELDEGLDIIEACVAKV
jgi:4-aminobutyrate aminotransferase/(S)-3-amino-2-methylpropionate transaminase